MGAKTHARVLNNKWAREVANGRRLPFKLEPKCTLLLRTTDGKLIEKAQTLYAGEERRGSMARAGAVLPFNYEAVQAARVALGAYRGCLHVRRKPVGQGGDVPSVGQWGGGSACHRSLTDPHECKPLSDVSGRRTFAPRIQLPQPRAVCEK